MGTRVPDLENHFPKLKNCLREVRTEEDGYRVREQVYDLKLISEKGELKSLKIVLKGEKPRT